MVHTSGVYLIILWIPFSEGAEFISLNETTWNNITTICQAALPEINYKASINGNEFMVDYTGNIEERDGVWVGYYLSTTPFEYIGCTKIRKRTAIAQFEKDIPGLCFSACKKKGVIGISNKQVGSQLD
ncbi:uncharacterized protein LOC132718288 isoform X2 [Ruditapes philippinarum]|uniref:uncharacterized protein LOC132718288 isoform X2 n=1 Tax=Ruditapes philippinarum TaxID=129788 RepID=UPI00295ACA82|nr:uncharacterized protein LOC132718288 isoform X2 [Ruditapes philippinarum]